MANKMETKYQENTAKLLEEAQPYLVGEHNVWRKDEFRAVGAGESYKEQVKTRIPLMSGRLRTDMFIAHDLPTDLGTIHCVHLYSGKIQLPSEFLIVLDGKIPYCVYLKRAFLTPTWTSKDSDQYEEGSFCEFVAQLEYINPFDKKKRSLPIRSASEWNYELNQGKIKLQWTTQLAPFKPEKFLFFFVFPPKFGWLRQTTFGLPLFYETTKAIMGGITEYNYDGAASEFEILMPSLSLWALPEFRETNKN